MTVTPEIMKNLAGNYDIAGRLTEELIKQQEKRPQLDRFVGWHPGYFRNIVLDEVTPPMRKLLTTDTLDSSFVKELEHVDGVLFAMEPDCPALVETLESSRLCVLTIDFCHKMFHKIENNANALWELADLLHKNGEGVWFNVPAPVVPDVEAKRKAILVTLQQLAQAKPKKFPGMVQDNLHALGFDKGQFSTKEIKALFEDIINGN